MLTYDDLMKVVEADQNALLEMGREVSTIKGKLIKLEEKFNNHKDSRHMHNT